MNKEKRIKELASEYSEEIMGLRETIHRHPEMGNKEYRTADLIESYLISLGIETERFLDTAVKGVLHGKSGGRTVALRADMDALPMRLQAQLLPLRCPE